MASFGMAVIGGGSVGLAVAASFAQAGAAVTLLVREAAIAPLRDAAITVAGMLGEHRIAPGTIAIADAAAPPEAAMACDLLVVTTKAQDVAAALEPFARPGTPRPRAALMMQNGLGASELARAALGEGTAVYATAMLIGMHRHGLAHVEVNAYSSPVRCGPLLGDGVDALLPWVALSAQGFLPLVHAPDIREVILAKVLFNTCMNPTGAIMDRSYGALLENAHARHYVECLADETLRVFGAAYGYRPAADGMAYVRDVLFPIIFPRSAPHRSSMVQDLAAGRRTEIDFTNGAIIRLGQQHGIATPFHEVILTLVHARETP